MPVYLHQYSTLIDTVQRLTFNEIISYSRIFSGDVRL